MKLIWHLVAKDLRRLRLALALLSLLIIAKIIFYAVVGGLFHAPDLVWLNRLQQVPELLLRVLLEPLIIYALVGRLVFEDSPVEHDAHWVTRPISGMQLFASKMAGAGLMFGLWPLLLNLPWWLACGFDSAALVEAGSEFVLVRVFVIALALACASLTDGFPRFVFWSLVSVAVFVLVQMILAFLLKPDSGLAFSRMLVWCCIGGSAALAVAGYQFATRRHRRALTLAVASMLAVVVVGGTWRWNLTKLPGRSLRPAVDDVRAMSVSSADPVHYRRAGSRAFAEVALRVENLPKDRIVTQVRAVADWTIDGEKAWSSQVKIDGAELTTFALCRMLLPASAEPKRGRLVLALPFSPKIARRVASARSELHTNVDFDLFRGSVLDELPLAVKGGSTLAHKIVITSVSDRLVPEGPLSKARRAKTANERAVGVMITQRAVDGILPFMKGRSMPTYYALLNRASGEIFLSDRAHSGPMAISTLNQVQVSCLQLVFPVSSTRIKVEDMALAAISLSDGQVAHCTVDLAPVAWVDLEAAEIN